MICILLAAGHSRNLEAQIKNDTSGRYSDLIGVPKALLPGGGPEGKRILDCWWDLLKNSRQIFSQVYLVTNADKFKHYERWATASDFPTDNIVNDGSTDHADRLGSVADLALCLRAKKILEEGSCSQEVLVIAGDMIFQDNRFDLAQLVAYLRSKPDGDLAMYYGLRPDELASSRGIVDVCPTTGRIKSFIEKPAPGESDSRNASVVFYVFRPDSLAYVNKYLSHVASIGSTSPDDRSMGKFLSWYLHKEERTVYGMKIPTGFGLIGQTTLEEYEEFLSRRNSGSPVKSVGDCSGVNGKITRRAFARVGLMGNPSDGFFGKTISLSIRNFWAEVSISESSKLSLIPHPICDPTEFGSLADLYGISKKEGYLGGLRLLQATCKKFYHFCSTHGVALSRRNFTLRYDTNIPRQVGLAGSSALVTATLRCLMDFYCLSPSDIPKEVMPQLILEVEVAELNIQAGLQDRVVQVYEGLVSMDFAEGLMASRGHGSYRNLAPAALPQFFLAYQRDPSDSGRIHSDVRARFDAGDPEVHEAMREFAGFAEEAEVAIDKEDFSLLADLMEKNFCLRRKLYGDACIGKENLRMIEIGQKFGAACKFPGSGGAIVGLLKDQSRFEELRRAYEEEGFVITKVVPNLPIDVNRA